MCVQKFNCYSCDSSQGHNGKEFECDFEDAMCGWTDQSIDAPVYRWDSFQRGDTLPDSGPSSDYTTGTATGTVEGTITRPFILLSFCHLKHQALKMFHILCSNNDRMLWIKPALYCSGNSNVHLKKIAIESHNQQGNSSSLH